MLPFLLFFKGEFMKLKKILLLSIMVFLLVGCEQNSFDETNIENKNSSVIDIEELENTEEKQEIEYFTVTKETPMENRGLKLEILGSNVYEKIEGEDFTDTPTEGKKYLVLFLSIQNKTGKEDYFNYNNIIVKLDEKKITDTFLINDPEKYTTIKTTIPNNRITQGYLVWEVPDKWEKLEVTYTGWTESLYTEPTIVLTPQDLEMPEEYKEDNRII